MALLVHPQSELIREPRLLVPRKLPVGCVKLDKSHPLAKYLRMGLLFGCGLDVATNMRFAGTSFGTAPAVQGKPNGLALVAQGGGLYVPFAGTWSGAYTYLLHAALSSVDSGWGGVFAVSNAGGTEQQSALQRYDTSTKYVSYHAAADYGNESATPSPLVADSLNSDCMIGTSSPGTSARNVVFNGRESAAQGTSATAPVSLTNGRVVFFGERSANASYGSDGHIYSFFAFSKYLTGCELQSFCADPYQFLIPA